MNYTYFDNAATTYVKPKQVHDFMYDFYFANSVNVGRGNHVLLNSSNKLVADTRTKLLSLFHANNLYETVFTPTATEAINIILQGQDWMENDVVYISPFEHNAVYRTIKYLERKHKLIVKILSYDKNSINLNFDDINAQFIVDRPKFVIATHVSNVCGKVIDINKLGVLAKSFGARIMFDCAQSAGLLDVDIIKNSADYLVFAGHKTLYGPFGCSGFICKKDSSVKPLIYGGTGIDSANIDMPQDLPTRFEAGSMNILAISGLYQALQWADDIGRNNIYAKEHDNFIKLKNLLSNYDFIKLIGNDENSTSIISCVFDNFSPDNIGDILSRNGIIVRTGLHCAPLAHQTLGTFPEGTVRFSVSYFTNDEDFTRLSEALDLFEE